MIPELCKSEGCNNPVEWVDEPEDICGPCIEKQVNDYEDFLLNERRLLLS